MTIRFQIAASLALCPALLSAQGLRAPVDPNAPKTILAAARDAESSANYMAAIREYRRLLEVYANEPGLQAPVYLAMSADAEKSGDLTQAHLYSEVSASLDPNLAQKAKEAEGKNAGTRGGGGKADLLLALASAALQSYASTRASQSQQQPQQQQQQAYQQQSQYPQQPYGQPGYQQPAQYSPTPGYSDPNAQVAGQPQPQGQYPSSQPGQYPQQAQAQYPAAQPAGQYPSSQPAGQYPASQPGGQYPASQPGGQYPASQPSGQYPASQPAGQYPQQAQSQYPQQQPQGQYPQQAQAQYPQQPGQYPQQPQDQAAQPGGYPAPQSAPYGAPRGQARRQTRGAAATSIKVVYDRSRLGAADHFANACGALLTLDDSNLIFTPGCGEAPRVIPAADVWEVRSNALVGREIGAFHIITKRGLYLDVAPTGGDRESGRVQVEELRKALGLAS
jgi:hypothetical protein